MVIALILLSIMIPVTGLVTGYFTLKAVQLGLKWQLNVLEKKEPEFSPVKEVVQNIDNKIQERKFEQIFEEWTEGGEDS